MKKIAAVLSVMVLALCAFGVLTKHISASRALFISGSDDELELAKQISLDALHNRAVGRGIAATADGFDVRHVEIDDLRMAHTRFQQRYGGVPVWQGEAIVHLRPDGTVSEITDDIKDSLAVDTNPTLSGREALRTATMSLTTKGRLSDDPKIELFVYRGDDIDRLVYRVELPRVDGNATPSVPVVFVDAHTGEIVDTYDNLQTGTGSSLYSGTASINTSSVGSTFYMEDLTRKQGTFNMNSTGNESTGSGGTQSRFTDTDDDWNSTIQRAGVDAHLGAAWTYDYYKNVHGRNGIDGSGGPGVTTAAANSSVSLITSRVHFGSSGRYNNAFWYNNMMSYGDGDGTNFSPLTTVDICGHEMTHGVTERTANLTYSKEPGALNESWSDVMGSMVELYSRGGVQDSGTWLVGEQAYTPGVSGDALRSMSDPHSVGDPDHYSLRVYSGTCTPSSSNDNCGVHTNSNIANHAYYLIAHGGTNRVSGVAVPGIGTAAAEKIWFRALTLYMTSSTNFAGARTATLSAATDLFGASSTQYNGVATGWCAVGVGTCPGGTPTPSPSPSTSPTPTPSPTPPSLIVNGSFEGSVTPWLTSGSGFFYTNTGNYPHSGAGYIYFGVNNSVSGQAYQTVTIPSTANGNLTFWLNVVSSETTTTTGYDKLYVEVRDTSGSLLSTLATYSNLNKGAAGAYVQRSLSAAAFKGRTVRIQFRSTTDSSLSTTFRVDDVALN